VDGRVGKIIVVVVIVVVVVIPTRIVPAIHAGSRTQIRPSNNLRKVSGRGRKVMILRRSDEMIKRR
jgi:hypothetical protein